MQLSIIIVNYNVRYFLEQALLSVRNACVGIESEVFVVDNNSVDDSVSMVSKKFPEVNLIVNNDNVGFSKANNQAIRQAKGKYILLLNPDTVVEEDTFSKCIAFMERTPKAGALGVKMIDGSGVFLPESKRGFPNPWVAFCKTFGLSKLFPKSKLFNHYHLGYLDKDEVHEIEVLAGAFMLLRKSVLDKIGLLDEAFFMYGEDIDLSYRVIKGGYKNYYFPDTTIIHYKGESTKKGSLNYVRIFYNAMIIFARKHFEGERKRLFVFMLQVAIYFRATLTLGSNLFKNIYLPLLDVLVIFIGMFFLKDFWGAYYFDDPDYYQPSFMLFNVPLYSLIWIGGIYFSGGYYDTKNIGRLIRGLFWGTLVLAAIYGFLDLEYRPSRVLIILGAIWAVIGTGLLRLLIQFMRFGNFNLSGKEQEKLVIVGFEQESKRVESLLRQAEVQNTIVGTVAPVNTADTSIYLSTISKLDQVVEIYKVDDIVFCSKDISSREIMRWMTKLGSAINYRIVPHESMSIIGSRSKNKAGELYTIDIRFNIDTPIAKRNKRLIDFLFSILLFIFSPLAVFFIKNKSDLFKNSCAVLFGKKTWVGYAAANQLVNNLPKLKPGVLSPADEFPEQQLNQHTVERLDFLYAKEYRSERDVYIIFKAFRELGRTVLKN